MRRSRIILKQWLQLRRDMQSTERIHFRFIQMPCCGQLLCWVNPRLPNYCPECGKQVYAQIRFPQGDPAILLSDENAVLKHVAE